MIDLVKLLVIAGDGGNGRVSFRREKYVPKGGPDGGDGGNGGSIIVRGNKSLSTLGAYAHKVRYQAESGGEGSSRNKHGAKGKSIVLEVPVGTKIHLVAENQTARNRRTMYGVEKLAKWDEVTHQKFYLEQEGQQPQGLPEQGIYSVLPSVTAHEARLPEGFDTYTNTSARSLLQDETIEKTELITIIEDQQEVVIAQGGFGGRGNDRFKGPAETTPLIAEYGTRGEQRLVLFELKLLADVGLVGFPNAGKSTFLSIATQARPKIANYPFTTLEPNLGVLRGGSENQELVLADIPGLIEGASEGKGLGFDFLRHIENSTALLFVLSLDEVTIYDHERTDEQKAAVLWQQYQQLRHELGSHNPEMLEKAIVVSVNKIDLYSPKLQAAISGVFEEQGISAWLFSGVTGKGVPELTQQLFQTVHALPE